MPPFQARIQFSNIQQVDSATVTLSHGITPSQAVIRIAPQAANIEPRGDMVLTFGSERIVLRDCMADTASYRIDSSGRLVELTILDRRWKWRFPTISGRYNVRGPDGKILKVKDSDGRTEPTEAVSDGERTARQLIELCLDAMGEFRRTLNNVPPDLRVEVNWDNDNAAQALQSVCDACGLRVMLLLDDSIFVTNAGNGRSIPTGPIEEYSVLLNPPEKPEAIVVEFAPSWFQRDWRLKAVGLETDGDIKPIDDLDYKPPGGWSASDPLKMSVIEGEADRAAALESVYRWFQVDFDYANFPGMDEETNDTKNGFTCFWKYPGQCDILGVQVFRHLVLGVQSHRRAIVWGEWFDETSGKNTDVITGSLGAAWNKSNYALNASIIPDGHSIDNRHSLVMFNDPIIKRSSNNTTDDPVLYLRSAVQARDNKTGEYVRYRYLHAMNTPSDAGNGRLTVTIPSMRAYHSKEGVNVPDNKAELDSQAKEIAEAYEHAYDFERAEVARYAGWLAITLDGALQSVTWHLDASGASTTVQRNSDEGSPTTLPYRLRRVNEKYALALAVTAKMDRQRKYPARGTGYYGDATDLPPTTGGMW